MPNPHFRAVIPVAEATDLVRNLISSSIHSNFLAIQLHIARLSQISSFFFFFSIFTFSNRMLRLDGEFGEVVTLVTIDDWVESSGARAHPADFASGNG